MQRLNHEINISATLINMSSAALILFDSEMLSNMQTMHTIEETRLIRLKMLKNELGSVSEISKKTGISYAQISQWINQSPDSKTGKVRNMNSDSARLIEDMVGKDRGWFDQPVGYDKIIDLLKELGVNDIDELSKSSEGRKILMQLVMQLPEESIDPAKRSLDVVVELSSEEKNKGGTKKNEECESNK